MTQVSPEVTRNFEGAAYAKRSEMSLDSGPTSVPDVEIDMPNFEPGYDMVPAETVTTGGIELPSLVEKKVADVATIALVNPAKAFKVYEDLKIGLGEVDLEAVLPDVAEADRSAVFAQELIDEKISADTGELLIGLDVTKIRGSEQDTYSSEQVEERDTKIEELKSANFELQMRILKLRQQFAETGATKEQLEAFDRTAHIMAAPQREAYDQRMEAHPSFTEKLRNRARATISKIAIRPFGLTRPQ